MITPPFKFGIGQPVTRKEDWRLLTGAGRFTDDLDAADASHLYVLRSPHAHARIARIDLGRARSRPGVRAVLTVDDLDRTGVGGLPCLYPVENRDGTRNVTPPRALLARGRVRYVGEPVAAVVADTPQLARDAADAIDVIYEALPAVVDARRALETDAPLLWNEAPGNRCFDYSLGDETAVARAFAKAAYVATLDVVNNRVVPSYLEPRVALAHYDPVADRYTIHTGTQSAHRFREYLAQHVFKVPEPRIRVVTPDVGGGFGGKINVYPEQALALIAAKLIGRPVKWVGDRSQTFLGDTHGRDNVADVALALDRDGRFLAFRCLAHVNLGAVLSNVGTIVPTGYTALQTSVYDIPVVYIRVVGAFTNTAPVCAYRGAGRPELIHRLERAIDVAAGGLGVDRIELRRLNLVRPQAMPYTLPLGLTYDSGDFPGLLDKARTAAAWDEFPARRAAAACRGVCRGIGIALYIDECAGPILRKEQVIIRFDANERISVYVGTQANGQGHETAFAQVVADRLGVPFETIDVFEGDSDATRLGGGGLGSRSMTIGGGATLAAVRTVIDRARPIAADLCEVAVADLVFTDGRFTVVGTDRSVALIDVARSHRDRFGAPLAGEGEFGTSAPTFPNGCHICEVEVDPESGHVDVVRYVVVDDFGRIVNPLLAAGQVHGGVAQGIGQALIERAVYDDRSGQLLSGSFMDYALPRAADVPTYETHWHDVPCTTNPLGAKGAAEAGAVGAPPSVISAIVDALAAYGVTHIDMPATPETVWRAIHAARKRLPAL